MRQYAFRIVNVFAREGRLTGNPLAVIEDARGLDDATMQALARQFNLSETTFILPSEKATARVRIFTPSYEMPFAGHPTLGTAHVVRALHGRDEVTLEMQAGIIPVSAKGERWTLQAVPPKARALQMHRRDLAEILGLEERDMGEFPLWVSAGREQLIVPLTSADAVRRTQPRGDAFSRLKSVDGNSMAYVFHDAGDAAGTVESRFFFPNGAAILEDPATGSACANLGAWFIAMGRRPPLQFEVSQGEFIGRPSTLQLEVNTDDEVFVGGDVIEIGSGQLSL